MHFGFVVHNTCRVELVQRHLECVDTMNVPKTVFVKISYQRCVFSLTYIAQFKTSWARRAG